MTKYLKFATSTVVMLGLMYLTIYSLEHVYWSETRAYMALFMGATMAIIVLLFMIGMYPTTRLNAGILAGGAADLRSPTIWPAAARRSGTLP